MSTIKVSQLGVKARSKNEMYRLLTVEAKIYPPPQKECSIYFIRMQEFKQTMALKSLYFAWSHWM